jgi:1,4-alpha-glucan branching enzyme
VKEDGDMIEKKKKKVKEEKTSEKKVEFTFHAPEAREVCLAGEFNSWNTQSLPMKKDKNGVWKTKVKLPAGRYEYKLFVDNDWAEGLPGAELVSNPFGTQNFVKWVK